MRISWSMLRRVLPILLAVTVVAGPAIARSNAQQEKPTSADAQAIPVVVELFTSEGCSSCPPADEVLAKLDQQSRLENVSIIALGEHVDYWNREGWRDRFSSSQFTQRQQEYVRLLHLNEPYTPEMVVDGRTQFVGSDTQALQKALQQESQSPKPEHVQLSWDQGKLDVGVSGNSTDPASVMLAITESGLTTSISGGENKGRVLTHAAVVRRMVKLGKLKNSSFSWKKPVSPDRSWNPQNLKAVVFVQDDRTGAILGAQSLTFPAHS